MGGWKAKRGSYRIPSTLPGTLLNYVLTLANQSEVQGIHSLASKN